MTKQIGRTLTLSVLLMAPVALAEPVPGEATPPSETTAGRSDRLQAFFEAQGLWTYVNKYHLDGRPLDRERSLGLASMNAVASLAATQARSWRFVDELWSVRCPRGTWRYYDGMLYLLAMLHVRGQFRPYMEARQGLSASFTSSSTSQPSLPHTRKRLATTSRWSSSLVHGLS